MTGETAHVSTPDLSLDRTVFLSTDATGSRIDSWKKYNWILQWPIETAPISLSTFQIYLSPTFPDLQWRITHIAQWNSSAKHAAVYRELVPFTVFRHKSGIKVQDVIHTVFCSEVRCAPTVTRGDFLLKHHWSGICVSLTWKEFVFQINYYWAFSCEFILQPLQSMWGMCR